VTKRNLAIITDREFGERVGIYRMLEIFESEKIRTSFFPTGITVQNYPEIFQEIVEQGHEVGTETWIHDYSYMKKREQEKKDLQKTVEAVKKVVGKAPMGYLSTGVAPSAVTPEVILELGYTYWMDPQHQETPYTLKVKSKELTVLSYFQDLNDYSSYQRAGRTPRDLLQMWKDCFDCLYEEGAKDPKFMMWGNHPFAAGRFARCCCESSSAMPRATPRSGSRRREKSPGGIATTIAMLKWKSGRISTTRGGAAKLPIFPGCNVINEGPVHWQSKKATKTRSRPGSRRCGRRASISMLPHRSGCLG